MRIVVTRVLSSAYKGDFAIAIAMLANLRAEEPGWELTILCREPDTDLTALEEYGSVLPELFSEAYGKLNFINVALRISRYILWSGLKIPCLDKAGKTTVDALTQARAMVFCGGGSPGGYGLHNLLLHAAVPVMMARRLRLPIIFTGVGVEPNPGRLQRLITRWVLKQASLIIARDGHAADSMGMAYNSKVRVAGDWAFLLPAADYDIERNETSRREGRPRLGINLRDPGPQQKGPGGQYPTDLLHTMSKVIINLMERTQADITVVSMNRSRKTDDYAFARRVHTSLPPALQSRVTLLPPDLEPGVVKAIIASMDLFISTRLHPAIFALESEVPTLALHHADKVRDMMQHFKLSRYFLPLPGSSAEKISEKALSILESVDEVRHELATKTPAMRDAARDNLALLAEHLAVER